MNWVKSKDTTGKIEPSQQFLLEEKLTFPKKTSGVIFYHDIPKESIVTLSKTPMSYVIPGKYTFDVNHVKTVLIKGIYDKCQITTTFAFSMSGGFLPIQAIYEGKTTRYLLKCVFPENFDIQFLKIIGTISENHWSNTEKTISFLKKAVFPLFKNVCQIKYYPNEQVSIVIMDTFKGQDNEEVAKRCCENNCVLIIVRHNLTNEIPTTGYYLK